MKYEDKIYTRTEDIWKQAFGPDAEMARNQEVNFEKQQEPKEERISWDDFFLTLCFMVRMRSIDPHTKHGCIVVDEDHNVLSMGYNSAPRNCYDDQIPLTRPEKYDWMVHSEEAAITNAARNGISLKGSTFYISGPPCKKCVRAIINCGAKKIVYGPLQCFQYDPESIEKMVQKMKDPIEIVNYDQYWHTLENNLDQCKKLIDRNTQEQLERRWEQSVRNTLK